MILIDDQTKPEDITISELVAKVGAALKDFAIAHGKKEHIRLAVAKLEQSICEQYFSGEESVLGHCKLEEGNINFDYAFVVGSISRQVNLSFKKSFNDYYLSLGGFSKKERGGIFNLDLKFFDYEVELYCSTSALGKVKSLALCNSQSHPEIGAELKEYVADSKKEGAKITLLTPYQALEIVDDLLNTKLQYQKLTEKDN